MNTDEEWVRTPRQARSQATLERFVEATRELLEEQGFEEITIAEIVERAERTVGSFYARFEDKYAVLYVLVDRLHRRIGDVLDAFCDPVRWDGVPLGEFVAESVRLNVQAYRRSGPLYRAALQASVTDERFRSRRMETMQLCAEAQKRFILTRLDELDIEDPARASDLMFELVSSTLDNELLFGRFTTTFPDSDGELATELVNRCYRVLGLEAATEETDTSDSQPAH